jgi:2'-5' RNA ligase
MVRLFVGSFLQEDEAARIDQFCTSNHERLSALTKSSVRFVTTANLHITWVFLGEVGEEKISAVKEQLSREVEYLKTGSGIEAGVLTQERSGQKYGYGGLGKKINIDLEYDYIEAWPLVAAARVLVATPSVVPEAVLKIGMTLRRAMAGLGTVNGEGERNLLFRPHITIARLNPAHNFGDGKLLDAFSQLLPIHQKIERLHLIKSHLGQGPGDYEIIDNLR